MRLAVLGAGMVGRAMVYDLCRQDDVDEVLVADRDAGKAREVAERYGAGKARGRALDVTDREAVGGFIEGSRAALGAVSYRFNQALAEIAIAAGVHWIDLGGNNDVVEAQFALSDRARAAGVAVVPDCGIAPGAVGILAARLLELAPAADSIRLRVGGLPLRPVPPFNYQVVFSVEGLINEYKEPAVCLRGGA
ncbi:MAG: saccharopine dehydrogenase NADP-binding domain-containing protein, partial [Candidatus Eisenbacteria bacterium]|nr:saccharopine dehydrogenase NADP-binding domain-containing protein [Candidatus Eisenbacteria bacterium]